MSDPVTVYVCVRGVMSVSSMTVKQLKGALEKRALRTTVNKPDLVERLKIAMATENSTSSSSRSSSSSSSSSTSSSKTRIGRVTRSAMALRQKDLYVKSEKGHSKSSGESEDSHEESDESNKSGYESDKSGSDSDDDHNTSPASSLFYDESNKSGSESDKSEDSVKLESSEDSSQGSDDSSQGGSQDSDNSDTPDKISSYQVAQAQAQGRKLAQEHEYVKKKKRKREKTSTNNMKTDKKKRLRAGEYDETTRTFTKTSREILEEITVDAIEEIRYGPTDETEHWCKTVENAEVRVYESDDEEADPHFPKATNASDLFTPV